MGEALPQVPPWEDDLEQPTLRFTSFVAFYEDSFAPMVRLAFLITGSLDSAEDLVHDAFARVYPRWKTVQHPKAYLRRSVINAGRCAERRTRNERDPRTREIPRQAVLNADEMFDALGALPFRQRAALVLKYYEGRSQSDIAELLGCREGTVASLLSRGREQLRR